MTASKEEICINALQEICMKKFREDEYSLNGPKEMLFA